MKSNLTFRPHHHAQAFTLVEMLLVLAILALLAGIIYPAIINRDKDARISAAKVQMSALRSALQLFELDNGSLPRGQNGLSELLKPSRDAKNWHGPYVESLPKDSWGRDYLYEFPGKHPPVAFDLMSPGPDGQAGTADDITNWQESK